MKYLNWIFACFLFISTGNQIMCQNFTEQLELIYAKEFSDDEPGGAILIKKGNNIIFLNSYGLADLESGEKITEHTIFNTGSISKTFVSNAILILQERGSLSLDNRLSTYFDDFDIRPWLKRLQSNICCRTAPGFPTIGQSQTTIIFTSQQKTERILSH